MSEPFAKFVAFNLDGSLSRCHATLSRFLAILDRRDGDRMAVEVDNSMYWTRWCVVEEKIDDAGKKTGERRILKTYASKRKARRHLRIVRKIISTAWQLNLEKRYLFIADRDERVYDDLEVTVIAGPYEPAGEDPQGSSGDAPAEDGANACQAGACACTDKAEVEAA